MIVALVPVKRLSDAKSRLAPRLTNEQRACLVVSLVERTVDALRGSGRIDRIALGTSERELARRVLADVVPDEGGLNGTLLRGVEWATAVRGTALLIVPGDLPLLTADDIREVAEAAPPPPGIVISRTQDGGTGALLLRPPEALAPGFGPDSYARHLERACRAAVTVRSIAREGLMRELDTQEDLEALEARLPAYTC